MNPASPRKHPFRQRGFALIVTLSLMILLTVIAVGLLSLSSMSLRSAGHGEAMQTARANAKLSLFLAIGDLQKHLGPDTRISATADQITGSDPGESTAPRNQRHWAGSYDAWPAGLPEAPRPEPQFLQWFVSGDPTKLKTRDYAGTTIGTDPKNSVEIVSVRSVGPDGDPVRVPLLNHNPGTGIKGRSGWWVSDLGTKASIAPSKELPTAIAETRADGQSAPGVNLKGATRGTVKPFSTLSPTEPLLANVFSFASSGFLADKPENIRGFFHDFTAQSRGLVTNVRSGGFRRDLSMELERPAAGQPSATGTALYKVNGENGINLQELWAYYNLYKELKRSGTQPFTTGGSISSGTSYLQLEGSPTACLSDDEFHFKQPAIISYQVVMSYQTRVVNNVNRLHLVLDPIVTFWNPLDVPVVVPQGLVMTVKYWSVPYDLSITKNGTLLDCPVAAVQKGDLNFLSLEMGGLERIVMKPGEILKMSQSGSTLARSNVPEIHSLAGKKGFNFGSGVAYPLLTRAGATIDVGATDNVVYASAKPNNLTDGSTSSSGNVLSGGLSHSRHYGLVHNEFYLGKDRQAIGDSVGIGGMYMDWDFGNKRLAPTATRGENTPGTKSSGHRYYANQRSDIFKTFTDGRKIPATGVKMPFMLLSFCAKTEAGSTLGTRTLARFNPKALHVDFYDFLGGGTNSEREWLPFEYLVEPMNGWKGATTTLDEDPSGRGYFGGGMDAANGTNFVTTHSIPREPPVSIAAFQHSFANGFEIQKPKDGYATLNVREPLLPQISHAIGNSLACPMIGSDKTSGMLPGNRPMADHSYLANQALWDDWFLSGIAPQTNGFTKSRNQKTVASEFFDGTGKLPVASYSADLGGQDPATILSKYFSGSSPSSAATRFIGSLIRVDGMFNVNSTSVEAWKSLLAGRKERPVVVRDADGKESIKTGDLETPVSGLIAPTDNISSGTGSVDTSDSSQWIGRRSLNDTEIDSLAHAIVKEVRKRGPFLSLADFVNRRVGSDKDLARSGAIQSALDSDDVPINEPYRSGSRATSGGGTFAFKDAETGPMSHGIPGIVKQADILTPIAPILSVRSDSFLIRGYGDKTDASGKVIARAICEAVVQRSAQFVDSTDPAEKTYASISTLNKTFGRRFEIVSFRWLSESES